MRIGAVGPVVEAISPGDHTFFVAEIVRAQAEEEAFDASYLLKERDLKPLHHLGADSYAILDEPLPSAAPPPEGRRE